jgi:hypothetical protein
LAKSVVENRTVGAFDKILAEGMISLNLKQGNENRVSVEVDSAWQTEVKVLVKNGTLTLLPSAKMRAEKKHCIVNVGYKQLKALKYVGNEERKGTKVRFKNTLRGDSLNLQLQGLDFIKLDYEVQLLNLNVDGANTLEMYGNADELSMKKSRVKVVIEGRNISNSQVVSLGGIFEDVDVDDMVVAIVSILGVFFVPGATIIIVVFLIVRGRRTRQRHREELFLKAMEVGKEVPVQLLFADRKKNMLNSGITWSMLGLGIMLFFLLVSGGHFEPAGIGAIPLCVGVAYLLKYYLGKKEK